MQPGGFGTENSAISRKRIRQVGHQCPSSGGAGDTQGRAGRPCEHHEGAQGRHMAQCVLALSLVGARLAMHPVYAGQKRDDVSWLPCVVRKRGLLSW